MSQQLCLYVAPTPTTTKNDVIDGVGASTGYIQALEGISPICEMGRYHSIGAEDEGIIAL